MPRCRRGRPRLQDDGPAQLVRSLESLVEGLDENCSGRRYAEAPGKLECCELVTREGERMRVREGQRGDAVEAITGPRQWQDDVVGHRDDEVHAVIDRSRPQNLHSLLRPALGCRIQDLP